MSIRVYGCSGVAKMSRTGESSTSFPAYMTPSRSTNWAMSPMSCPTRITEASRSFCTLRQGLHHLLLHHHVQGAGGLVGDDDPGAQADGDGDAGPLLHAPAQLVGKHGGDLRPQADRVQEIPHALVELAPGHHHPVIPQGVGDLLLDPHHRVQRVHRSLGNQGDARQPHLAHLLVGEGHHVDAVQPDLTGFDPSGRLDHAEDGQHHRGLAGAGLSGQAQALLGVEAKADVVGGSHRAARGVVEHPQTLHAEDVGLQTALRSLGLAISSRPTLRKKRPRKTMRMMAMGAVHHHHQPLMRAAL